MTTYQLLDEYMKENGIAEKDVNLFDFEEWKMLRFFDSL